VAWAKIVQKQRNTQINLNSITEGSKYSGGKKGPLNFHLKHRVVVPCLPDFTMAATTSMVQYGISSLLFDLGARLKHAQIGAGIYIAPLSKGRLLLFF